MNKQMTAWQDLRFQAEGHGISPELSRSVNLLGALLGQVVHDQAGEPAYDRIERYRILAKDADWEAIRADLETCSIDELEWVIRSYTTFFHLVNKAEQEEIIRINRSRESEASIGTPARNRSGRWSRISRTKGSRAIRCWMSSAAWTSNPP